MKNFHNKLGMFIHWGVYSATELHEQAIIRYNMDIAQYEKEAMNFNPVDYDPEKWVLAAKNAGMKYICITTKHHDGFCMWDTKYTDYNIRRYKNACRCMSQAWDVAFFLLFLSGLEL